MAHGDEVDDRRYERGRREYGPEADYGDRGGSKYYVARGADGYGGDPAGVYGSAAYGHHRSGWSAGPGWLVRRTGESAAGGLAGFGGRFSGRGPRTYQRPDERIRDEVCERLTADPDVDASDIEVSVGGGEVTLAGVVHDRGMKRMAEDAASDVFGVRDVHNRLRIAARAGSDIGVQAEAQGKETIGVRRS